MSVIIKHGPALQGPANCWLVAIRQVVAESVTDAEIVSACWAHGYRGDGMFSDTGLAAAQFLGVEHGPLRGLFWPRWSLAEFCRQKSKGVFFVFTRDHVLVVRDGVIVDPNYRRRAARRRVWCYARVLNARSVAKPDLTRATEVRFTASTYDVRKRGTESNWRRYTAERYVYERARVPMCLTTPRRDWVPIATLLAHSEWTMADLRWDLKHGWVEIR